MSQTVVHTQILLMLKDYFLLSFLIIIANKVKNKKLSVKTNLLFLSKQKYNSLSKVLHTSIIMLILIIELCIQ